MTGVQALAWQRVPVEIRIRFVLIEGMRRLAWCVAVLCTSSVIAAQPVLHEYFQLDGEARLPPSSVQPQAPSFPIPVEGAANAPPDPALAAGAVPSESESADVQPERPSANDEYRLDGNTSTPSQVGYSDPFTPSIPPFKRLYAYDSVNTALELVVANSALQPVRVGGVSQATQDQFMGKQSVALAPEQPLRLPTVGPGVKVLNARLTPGAAFSLFEDSAENLFLKSGATGTHEWVVHMAIERASFGAPYPDVGWNALEPHIPRLPDVVTSAAQPVLGRLKLSKSVRPAVALRRMVEYFRNFEPKDERRSGKGVQLYRDIALSKVGVCRHRAFAFVVTGLALGLPSRFVRNEAHAWVEVFDGRLWHRLDLGGAASEMALTSDLDVPHEAPPDPYTWPPKSESGESMVDRALAAAMGGSGGNGNGASAASGSGAQAGGGPASTTTSDDPLATPPSTSAAAPLRPEPTPPEMPDAEPTPATTLTVTFGGANLKRGERFAVQGVARNARGEACSLMRIDVTLFDSSTRTSFTAGTLVTDEQGRYAGQLVLPQRVPVGDYRVRVSTPGHMKCAATQ